MTVEAQLPTNTLVVFVHGLGGSPQKLASVIAASRSALGQIDVYAPQMPYGPVPSKVLTRARPADIVGALVDEIDRRWAEHERRFGSGYARILLVGHSLGGLVLRKVAVLAFGETETAPFEEGYERFREPRPWAGKLTRLVMLAGMAKGWSLTSASTWLDSLKWRVGMAVGTLIGAGRGIVMETRRGLPFVAQTRLQWLALARSGKAPALDVVQILGTRDDLVAPDDMIDLAVDVAGGGGFALLEMPQTDHPNIIEMSDPSPDSDPVAVTRWNIFTAALTRSLAELQATSFNIAPALLSDGELAKPDGTVTDVVFVIHGIRDRGFWTHKVARRIKEEVSQADDARCAR